MEMEKIINQLVKKEYRHHGGLYEGYLTKDTTIGKFTFKKDTPLHFSYDGKLQHGVLAKNITIENQTRGVGEILSFSDDGKRAFFSSVFEKPLKQFLVSKVI